MGDDRGAVCDASRSAPPLAVAALTFPITTFTGRTAGDHVPAPRGYA